MQDLFGGMDPVIANAPESASGIYEIDVMKQRYWRDTPQQRREALMPFFWKTLVPAGVIYGNQAKGSKVTVQNDQWFSYPGYSEMLTGRPQPDVKSNDLVRYPNNRTVLEYARETLGLKYPEVAQIGSWDGFKYAASSRDGAFYMNGGRDAVPAELSTPDIDKYVDLSREIQQLWEESSNDVLAFRIAKEYLLKNKPRLFWIGLGQSDDWAHARRYDLVLDYLHFTDRRLADLWQMIQSTEPYRGRTTLIITTDHGRGRTPADWAEHDYGIQGCQDVFIAVVGPDTPATGEARERRRTRTRATSRQRSCSTSASTGASSTLTRARRSRSATRAPERALSRPNCDPRHARPRCNAANCGHFAVRGGPRR